MSFNSILLPCDFLRSPVQKIIQHFFIEFIITISIFLYFHWCLLHDLFFLRFQVVHLFPTLPERRTISYRLFVFLILLAEIISMLFCQFYITFYLCRSKGKSIMVVIEDKEPFLFTPLHMPRLNVTLSVECNLLIKKMLLVSETLVLLYKCYCLSLYIICHLKKYK